MAIPLPLVRAAWRRQIAWRGLLALIALIALATLAAPSEAALPRPLSGVGETIRSTPVLKPVVDVVDRASVPIAGVPPNLGDTVRRVSHRESSRHPCACRTRAVTTPRSLSR